MRVSLSLYTAMPLLDLGAVAQSQLAIESQEKKTINEYRDTGAADYAANMSHFKN